MRWRKAIPHKLLYMLRMQVWKKVKRSSIPKGQCCIKWKCVFDIKHNGVFRACLVACGYYQIPGVDFQDAYSPIINDPTFCLIILIQLIFGLCLKFHSYMVICMKKFICNVPRLSS
jgi:hypothetical protein